MNLQEILTSFSLGLLATTSPCVLPLYPGFLAYLSGGQERSKGRYAPHFLGFFVLLGVLTMMLLLGLIFAAFSISIGRALSVIVPLADLLILALGVMLLFDLNLFKQLPQVQSPLFAHPFANAFIYGLLYGPIALPCSGPLVVGIFAFSLTAGEAVSKLLVFLWFGLGFGVPLLALSFLSGAAQRWITRLLAQHSRAINLAAGLILIAVAIYDLSVNWGMVQSLFGL